MRSIRRFLVIVLLASITLFNFVAAIRGYHTGMQESDRLFDAQLATMAHVISQMDVTRLEPVSLPALGDLAIQVYSADRQLLYRSGNAPAEALSSFSSGFSYAGFASRHWRSYCLLSDDRQHWIMVAERMDNRFHIAESIVLKTLFPIIVGLPVIGLLIWLIVGSGLKPLHDLASQLAGKKPGDLSALDNADTPIELTRLTASINSLLQRLANSFNREKRFSGDAAHELRTPLSVLKTQLYNLQKKLPAGDPAIAGINASLDRMTHLIEQMLILYRTTPEQFMACFADVDLYTLAQDVIAGLYDTIDRKQQHIELIGDHCRLVGDEFALTALLKNLVDNAGKYTPAGGQIRVSLSEQGKRVHLVVEDSGPGIDPTLHERVFERFYRVNGDMHASATIGCGLGLSIVHHIVDLHQGEIYLQDSQFATGLAVHVWLEKNRSLAA